MENVQYLNKESKVYDNIQTFLNDLESENTVKRYKRALRHSSNGSTIQIYSS